MSKSKLAIGLLVVWMVPCICLAEGGPRWSYIEAGYMDFDPESGLSDDGGYAAGSLRLGPFHLIGEYDAIGDYTLWSAGGGWHGLLGKKADLFAEALWNDVDVDSSGGSGFSDDGYEVAAGARWNVLQWLQLKGAVNYLDLDKSGDDTTGELEAVVAFFKGRLGVGANYETGDTDTVKVFGRFSFGKN
jgi:hypothetical protein